MIEVVFISVVTVTVCCVLPFLYGKCKKDPECVSETCENTIKYGKFLCEEGYYNPLASLLLAPKENTIEMLFYFQGNKLVNGWFPNVSLIIGFFTYFIIAVITYGIAIPSGLFVPLILIGSNIGHLAGKIFNKILPYNNKFDVGTYSLLGAAAVLGGATRMTISLTVILVEITNDIYYLLPIMVSIITAKWVGDRFNSALYDSHIGLKSIPYLEPKLPKWIPTFMCAHDVMTKDIVTLPLKCSVKECVKVLSDPNHNHNAFPVLNEDNKFVGLILRTHIMALLKHECYTDSDDIKKLSQTQLIKSDLQKKSLQSLTKQLHLDQILKSTTNDDENEHYVDFGPYIHLTPFTVKQNMPILRIYGLFRNLGLRHLVVFDNDNNMVGIITTSDLSEDKLERAFDEIKDSIKYSSNKTAWIHDRISFLTNTSTTNNAV